MEHDRPTGAPDEVHPISVELDHDDGAGVEMDVDILPPDELDREDVLLREIDRLEGELSQRDHRLREYIDAHQHAVSEMEAARQRMLRDREGEVDRARARVAEVLLGAIDDLDRALAGATPTANFAAVIDGVGMVHEHLRQTARELGVERMSTVGRRFDPNLHEAVGVVLVREPSQDQQIIGEELAGYLFKGKLLRAARVIVGSHGQD